jgi:hypothetical protein
MIHAAGRRLGFSQRQELVGNEGGRGNARGFKLNGVVDTPRRAGTSIAERIDDQVASVAQLLKTVRLGAAHLSFGNQFHVVVALHEKLADIGKKLVGVGFVIVEQADALVIQAAVFSVRELGLFGSSGCRWIHNRYQFSFHALPRHRKGAMLLKARSPPLTAWDVLIMNLLTGSRRPTWWRSAQVDV